MRPTRITAAPPRALGLRKPGRFPRAPSLPGPRPSGEHGGGGVGRKDGASPPSPCPLGDPSCRDARPRAPARGDFGPLSWNIAGAAFPRSPGRPPDANAGPRGRGTPSVKVIWTRGSRCSCTARLGPWTQPFPPPAATPAPPGGGGAAGGGRVLSLSQTCRRAPPLPRLSCSGTSAGPAGASPAVPTQKQSASAWSPGSPRGHPFSCRGPWAPALFPGESVGWEGARPSERRRNGIKGKPRSAA